MKEQIIKLRNELYSSLPTGIIDTFELIKIINVHIHKLDVLIEQLDNKPKINNHGNKIKYRF